MKNLIMALALAAGLFATDARAETVTVTDSAPQTVDGEDFTFDFGPLKQSKGHDGTLTLYARGDYTLSNDFEFVTWDLDGAFGGSFKPAGDDIIAVHGTNDVEWSREITLDGAALEAALTDGELSLFVDLSDNVHAHWGQPFLSATIRYAAIPEPASLALLGLGVCVWIRRRRRA